MKFDVWRASATPDSGPPVPEATIKGHYAGSTEPIYEIDISTLADLMAFIGRVGPVVLQKDDIMIYDTHIE